MLTNPVTPPGKRREVERGDDDRVPPGDALREVDLG